MMRIAVLLPTILCGVFGLLATAAAQVSKPEAQANRDGFYWTSSGWMRAGDSRPYRWSAGAWVLANDHQSPQSTSQDVTLQRQTIAEDHWIRRLPRPKAAVWPQEPQINPQAARDAENRRVIKQYQQQFAQEHRIQREALELFPWASQGDERTAYIIEQRNVERHQAHDLEKARIIASGMRDFGRGRE
jgi:hypothetical protein